MNFAKISGRVSDIYLADPYTCIVSYRRSLKFLESCKRNDRPILLLGSKNRLSFLDSKFLPAIKQFNQTIDKEFVMQASGNFGAFLCLDPLVYMPIIQNLPLPLVVVATAAELAEHPELSRIADYIIPQSSSKLEEAISHWLESQVKPSNKK